MFYLLSWFESLVYLIGTRFPLLTDGEVYAVAVALLVAPVYVLCVLFYRPRRSARRSA
jgi:hypothetical protein